jgi:hypothetical protein
MERTSYHTKSLIDYQKMYMSVQKEFDGERCSDFIAQNLGIEIGFKYY